MSGFIEKFANLANWLRFIAQSAAVRPEDVDIVIRLRTSEAYRRFKPHFEAEACGDSLMTLGRPIYGVLFPAKIAGLWLRVENAQEANVHVVFANQQTHDKRNVRAWVGPTEVPNITHFSSRDDGSCVRMTFNIVVPAHHYHGEMSDDVLRYERK